MPQHCISEKIGSEWVLKKASDNLEDFDVEDQVWFYQLLRTEGVAFLKVGDTMYDVFHDGYKTLSEMRYDNFLGDIEAVVIRELLAENVDVGDVTMWNVTLKMTSRPPRMRIWTPSYGRKTIKWPAGFPIRRARGKFSIQV